MIALELLQRNWKVIAVVAAAVLMVVLFALTFEKCGEYFFEREYRERQENINAMREDANEIDRELQNLNVNLAIANVERNAAVNNFRNAQNGTNAARSGTNEALEGVNRVEQSNYSNKTLEDAKRARCRALSNSPECR